MHALQRSGQQDYYHNAHMLLKCFRSVWWRIHEAVEDIDMACQSCFDRRIDDIIRSTVEIDLYITETRLQERLQSIEFSKSMIDYMTRALERVRRYPEYGECYYNILYECYISSERPKEDAILDKVCLSRSHFFRLKRKAIDLFGVALWGYLYGENARLKQPEQMRLF